MVMEESGLWIHPLGLMGCLLVARGQLIAAAGVHISREICQQGASYLRGINSSRSSK